MDQSIKYQIGYTTGVFDLFHIGHLNMLKRSKNFCNYLIVGVNDDDLVVNVKGEKPVVPFHERLEILQSIKYVDVAVGKGTDDIDNMLAYHKYGYSAFFKGSDWNGTPKGQKLESHMVSLGIKIIYFPYTDQISTSKIRSEIS